MVTRIEFCGLPGSGKSTWQEVLLPELRRLSSQTVLDRKAMVDRCLRTRNDGLIKNFIKLFPEIFRKQFISIEYALPELHQFVSANPSFIAHIFNAISRSNVSVQWRNYVLYAVFRSIVEHYLASTYLEQGIVVSDESLVHRGYTIFGNLRSDIAEEELIKFADLVPSPDFLFFVEASPASCDRRLSLRPAYPLFLSRLSPDERVAQLSLGHMRLKTIVDQIEKRGIPVFRIDNSGTKEQSMQQMKRCALVISDEVKKSTAPGLPSV